MKKTFLKTEIKRAIIQPETDLEEVCIVPEMGMQYIDNATITVSDDGYAFVTWLQPVKDWRYYTADFLAGCAAFAIFLATAAIFWSLGVTSLVIKLQQLGVI